MREQTFDRVRPRTADQADERIIVIDGEVRVPDREGKRALFSSEPEPPSLGSIAMTCTRCEARSVVSWSRALRMAFPSVPALLPGAGARIWIKCPTCQRRSWVDLSLRY